ncbi:MAG TPA: hypothetical protein VFE46_15680 [Pirellulales bacterium]|jgi:hypothetical protein|nr:hypothetical protein [Pirellulales bacterium]
MSIAEPITEWDILNRIVRSDHSEWPTELAEAILRIEIPKEDRQRVHELLVKNQNDELTASEKRTLESYRNVSVLLDIVRSKARMATRKTSGQE